MFPFSYIKNKLSLILGEVFVFVYFLPTFDFWLKSFGPPKVPGSHSESSWLKIQDKCPVNDWCDDAMVKNVLFKRFFKDWANDTMRGSESHRSKRANVYGRFVTWPCWYLLGILELITRKQRRVDYYDLEEVGEGREVGVATGSHRSGCGMQQG